MKKYLKFLTIFAVLAVMLMSMCSCGKKIAESKVKSVDDLPGAVIGTQLGTTGDIYASD